MDEDIPPLEDMSSLVDRVKEIRLKRDKQVSQQTVVPAELSSSASNDKSATGSLNKSPKETAKRSESSLFGGMQKGFLFGNKPKQKKSPVAAAGDTEHDYVVKPTQTAESSLVLDDVQTAMKETGSKLLDDKSWITDDLMKKIEGSDTLLKQLSDPRFNQAIQWMQKDPKAAMEYYKNDVEVQMFFKQFYKILGEHFTELGDKTPSDRTAATSSAGASPVSQSTSQMSAEDKIEMDRILSDPKIKEILMKPDIQNLFTLLRTDPNKVQQLLKTCDPRMRSDIQTLVQARLLDFQQH